MLDLRRVAWFCTNYHSIRQQSVNRTVSTKGKQRFKTTPRRLLLKRELELGERKAALAEDKRAFHAEAYTAEMVRLWRDADDAAREGLAKAFYEATGNELHAEVTQSITGVLQKRWCGGGDAKACNEP